MGAAATATAKRKKPDKATAQSTAQKKMRERAKQSRKAKTTTKTITAAVAVDAVPTRSERDTALASLPRLRGVWDAAEKALATHERAVEKKVSSHPMTAYGLAARDDDEAKAGVLRLSVADARSAVESVENTVRRWDAHVHRAALADFNAQLVSASESAKQIGELAVVRLGLFLDAFNELHRGQDAVDHNFQLAGRHRAALAQLGEVKIEALPDLPRVRVDGLAQLLHAELRTPFPKRRNTLQLMEGVFGLDRTLAIAQEYGVDLGELTREQRRKKAADA